MNQQERQAIEWECAKLIAHYANLVDASDWAAVAALYTEDAVFARPTSPDQPLVGREAILAAFRARPPRVTRHVCSNVVIEVDGADSATGVSAMVLYLADKPPLAGSFHDRFRRTSEGWRFAERRGSVVIGG